MYFDGSSSLIETSQLICVANWLTALFEKREVWGFRLISGLSVFRWAHGFCRFLVEFRVNLQRMSIFILFYLFVYLFSTGIFSPGVG